MIVYIFLLCKTWYYLRKRAKADEDYKVTINATDMSKEALGDGTLTGSDKQAREADQTAFWPASSHFSEYR